MVKYKLFKSTLDANILDYQNVTSIFDLIPR